MVKATQAFGYALYGATNSVNYAKGTANTAVVWADAFVDFAATTLTNQEDDAAASAIKAQATAQLATANAIAASAAPASSRAPYATAGIEAAPAPAVYQADGANLAQGSPITLVGLVAASATQLLEFW